MKTPGFDKPLYILPFDHRGSFQTKLFGWTGALTPEQTAQIAASKQVIYDAFRAAISSGVPEHKAGILVDEQFGEACPRGADFPARRYPNRSPSLCCCRSRAFGVSRQWPAPRGTMDPERSPALRYAVANRYRSLLRRCCRRWPHRVCSLAHLTRAHRASNLRALVGAG